MTVGASTQPVHNRESLIRALDAVRDGRLDPPLPYRRVAGGLFIFGVTAAVPIYFLLDPRPGPLYWLIAAVSTTFGAYYILSPRMAGLNQGFHTILTAAGLVIAACTVVASLDFAFFYVFPVSFGAFALDSRRGIAAWIATYGVLLLLPAVWNDGLGSSAEAVQHAVIIFPVLVAVGAMVTYLREQLDRQRAQLRAFAEQTIEFALQMDRDERQLRVRAARAPREESTDDGQAVVAVRSP